MMISIIQEKKDAGPQQLLNKKYEIGIDEVGRGAVFGPVFAAAVVLTRKNELILKELGVTDSKKLTRENFFCLKLSIYQQNLV